MSYAEGYTIMIDTPLSRAVDGLADVLHRASDTAMGRVWAWGDYTEEGARFVGFVAYGLLRTHAAQIAVERTLTQPLTIAQRLLGQYHSAFRDLHALLIGVDDPFADRSPGEGIWSLRDTLQHMIETDATFYAMIRTNLERHRAGQWAGEPVGEADYFRLLGSEEAFNIIMAGPLDQLLAYHADLHETALVELADVADAETELPARFWESRRFPFSYRLQRYDAHIRQHTIQVEQIFDALGRKPSEGFRQARLLANALAEVENAQIGAPEFAAEGCAAVARQIKTLTAEVAPVLRAGGE
jgi:uncharacterized damage-inducible protein DinB